MKPSRSAIHRKTHAHPNLRFEDQKFTSFSGLVFFKRLFEHLRLKVRVQSLQLRRLTLDFDGLHGSGNVHDSNGAQDFILACVRQVKTALPEILVEVRMDSTFFSYAIVGALGEAAIEYTISVPFERYSQLTGRIEQRCRWHGLTAQCDTFESAWKPKSWTRRHRFIFVR